MCTNYNAAQPAFADKESMLQYAHAYSGKTTEHLLHGVECDPEKSNARSLYTRSAPVRDQDLKTYDHGLFQVAVCNSPAGFANQVLGELWCCYKVMLRKPKLFTNRGFLIDRDIFITPSTTAKGVMGHISAPLGIDTAPATIFKGFQNNIGCALRVYASNGNTKLMFPDWYSGAVKISIYVRAPATATSFTLAAPKVGDPTGNVVPVNMLYTDEGLPTWRFQSPPVANSTTTPVDVMCNATVAVTASTGGVNNEVNLAFDGTEVTGVATICYITVEEININGIKLSGMDFVNSAGVIIAGNDV
jgi:hypothetical protein